MAHVMWDLHEDDVLVEPATPHLTILDIFMLPDATLFCKVLRAFITSKNTLPQCFLDAFWLAHSMQSALLEFV